VTFGRWILGVALLAAIVAPLALGARALRRRFLPELDGPTAVLADVVLTISALVVLAELVGVVGLLEPLSLLVAAAAAGAGGVALARPRPSRAEGPEPAAAWDEPERPASGGAALGPAASGAALTWVAFAAAAFVFAAWLRRTLVSLDFGIGGVDSTWYHLTFAAEFAEGSVAAIPYADVDFPTAFYPANVELLHAVGMLAFGTAALSPLLSLAALGLGFLAGWCVGRPFGVAPLTLLATTVVLGIPALFTSQAGEAKNDLAGLAFLLAAVAFVLAKTAPERRPALLALAGAAAGLAAGTKLNLLAPAGALLVAVLVLHRRAALAFASAAAATGGYWFARNLVATGNPLPWLGPLPQPAEARQERTLAPLSDYVFDAGAWDAHFLPGLEETLGPAWPAIAGLALLGAALALARGTPALRAVAAVALVTAAAYVVTPGTAAGPDGEPSGFALNVRFVSPALAIGTCLLAVVAARRWAPAVAAALAGLIAVTQLAPDPIWEEHYRRPAVALALLAALALVAARRLGRPWLAAAAAAAVLTIGVWPLERDFHRRQYTAALPPYTTWSLFAMGPVYAWARDEEDLRIAVTGSTAAFFQFPLRGPALDNDVEAIGRRGAHGSFTPLGDCDELRRALRGHTHAVVSPYIDVWSPFRPGPPPRELACVRASGAREVLRSGRIHVFALRPP
jgi:hypothetical protein